MARPAVCEVDGCQKAVGMLLKRHYLCNVHSDVVIDWAREAGKNVNSLTTDEVATVASGGTPPRQAPNGAGRGAARHS